jgi:hypothetical protein
MLHAHDESQYQLVTLSICNVLARAPSVPLPGAHAETTLVGTCAAARSRASSAAANSQLSIMT